MITLHIRESKNQEIVLNPVILKLTLLVLHQPARLINHDSVPGLRQYFSRQKLKTGSVELSAEILPIGCVHYLKQ